MRVSSREQQKLHVLCAAVTKSRTSQGENVTCAMVGFFLCTHAFCEQIEFKVKAGQGFLPMENSCLESTNAAL